MATLLVIEVDECYRCPFLNCSDTGEDCNLLSDEINESRWSNIDFQYDEGWRYDGCPLIHHENLNKGKGVIRISKVI